MASQGKFQNYHDKIKRELQLIQQDQGYRTLSNSFVHWYLEKELKMDEQQIAEANIDGEGDCGIDAIVVNNDSMSLFQFKFPESESGIEKHIKEDVVLKLINGYNKLVDLDDPKHCNENFRNFRDIVKTKEIYSYKFIFVVFHQSFAQHAKEDLERSISDIKNKTGNEVNYEVVYVKNICDIYDRLQRKSTLDVKLKYKRFDQGYNHEDDIKSYVGFLSGTDLIEACKDHMELVFDENIRLYEGKNNVNEGIFQTATGEESKNFFFYHNGVVFICNKCKNSTGTQTVNLSGASVVNGCQTITTLKRAYEEKKLKDDVFIQFRVIETTDFELRANITEFLNSQTQIKDSYFLANNTFIRNLQSDLLGKGYFLERLANEYTFKKGLGSTLAYEKKHILALDKVIQVYSAFYYDEYASKAKSGKGELFNKRISDVILKNISAEKVIKAFEWYNEICQTIRLFRKCRRSATNDMSFLTEVKKRCSPKDWKKKMDDYLFLNTGDLLILNTVAGLEKIQATEDKKSYILEAIKIIKTSYLQKQIPPSQFTKNNAVFSEIQKKVISKNNLIKPKKK